MIKAVLFDLGDTLVDLSTFLRERAIDLDVELFESIGINIAPDELKNAVEKVSQEIETKYRGSPKKHEFGIFFYFMSRFLGYHIDRMTASELGYKFWVKQLEEMDLIPNAIEILGYLQNGDYDLAIVTNDLIRRTNDVLNKFNLRPYFTTVVISERVGKEKCTGVPYSVALKNLKLRPKEAIAVGDRIDEDILGAKLAGIKSVKFNFDLYTNKNYSNTIVEPDYVIDDLIEIKQIL
jgi:putative hydrolase of the HAD superfamily